MNPSRIYTLRAIDIEALQEKILATHEQELSSLTAQLKRFVETVELYRLAATTRAEIRKVIIPTDTEDKPHAQN